MPTPDEKPTEDQHEAETKTTASAKTPSTDADLADISSGYGSAESGSMDAGHRYTGGDDADAIDTNADYTDDSQRIGTPVSDLNDDRDAGADT